MKRGKKFLALAMSVVMLGGTAISVSAAELKDLFDAKYYSDQYEDLKAAYGEDEEALWVHYLVFGMKEGRNASDRLNVEIYRSNYVDLDRAFGDDWTAYVNHYLTFGINEGRDGGGLFDAASYANRYEDLKAAFGYDFNSLLTHYQDYGTKEGRRPISQFVEEERIREEAVRKAQEEREEYEQLNYTDTEVYPDGSYYVTVVENGSIKLEQEYSPDGRLVSSVKYNDSGDVLETVTYDESGKIEYSEKNTYNSAGVRVESIMTDETRTHVSVYDNAGNEIKQTVYDATGKKLCEIVMSYDAAGNEIESVETDYTGDVVFVIRKTMEYNAQNLLTVIKGYYDGQFSYEDRYTYNDSDQEVKRVELNNLGVVNRTVVTTYYASGAIKTNIAYFGESSDVEYVYEYYDGGGTKSEQVYMRDGTLSLENRYNEEGEVTYSYSAV